MNIFQWGSNITSMEGVSQIVELNGHLIDSMILPKVMNKVMNHGGWYDFLEFHVGKNPKETSTVRLRITGRDKAHLVEILDDIHTEGAIDITQKSVTIKKAVADMTLPPNFYCTTNNKTLLFHNNRWITTHHQMMDKCIVIRDDNAWCMAIRDIHKGDDIVCGEEGVRVVPPSSPRDEANIFEFMGSSSSSERPTHHMAQRVASNMHDIKKSGGRIVLVGGPAIVHTGSAGTVAAMIRAGYIDGILAGNALAVHDIENALYGTSLGMRTKDATLASKGHRHHMDTVNTVFTHGSIRNMVDSGTLQSGIFYECIKHDIPFVLAGSIRDDGPLPDVITDVVEAQRQYKKLLQGVQMVLMVSTMLHSIATGNMLPSDVRIVAVDINQPTVTKLIDRGTWQALGIVTDVGAFFPLVQEALDDLKNT